MSVKIDCIDNLILFHGAIEKYPLLGLYLTNNELFSENYIIIEDSESVNICSRYLDTILEIRKDDVLFDVRISDIKRKKAFSNKKKLLTLGSIEIFKTCTTAPQ